MSAVILNVQQENFCTADNRKEVDVDTQKKIGYLQGCLTSVGIFMVGVFGVLILIVSCIQGCGKVLNEMDLNSQPDNGRPVDECGHTYTERWSAGVDGADAAKVVRIKLQGVISRESVGSMFSGELNGAMAAKDRIRAARADKEVRAVIIEINSPGGEVAMSDIVWHELEEFKSSATNRMVFAHLMDMACSGGYYVAAAADYIYALPTTITGSIGVIIPAINAAGLAEKIGVKPVSIASSKNKDLLNPLMPTNPAHVEIVKKTVDESYERFVDIVAKGRRLPASRVKEIADGRILSARDALKCRLVDGIGYEDDLLKIIEKKLGGRIKVVRYEANFSFENFFIHGLMMKAAESVKRSVLSEFTSPSAMQYR